MRAPPASPKPKACGELAEALVGQPVGERLGIGGALLEHLADEGLLVDLALEPEGAERHLEQPAVGDEVGGGGDRADLLLEVGDVALRAPAPFSKAACCAAWVRSRKRQPAMPASGIVGWKLMALPHAAGRPRSRASRGSRPRSARIAW